MAKILVCIIGAVYGNTSTLAREMVNSENGGDNRSYEGNSSLFAVVGPIVPPADPTRGAENAPTPDPS
ncbi:UNVERIFIED_CONTAM: hypothetical protein Sradi_3991900 [Sesamum radiatum]|uniref:Uncharacterized protein n=1 Tax=Sesamum radiatum TaxID=300843 RepID=A0AAW2PJQ5_SESRA